MSEALEEMYLFGEEKMEKAVAQMKREFASSPYFLTSFAVSFLLSSVRGGKFNLTQVPSLFGATPNSALIIAFSNSFIILLSKGVITSVTPSLTLT